MSRSKHQRHPTSRTCKKPRAILSTTIKDGRTCIIWKHIRLKPYGRKNFIGLGEEEFSTKFGYYCTTQTCKKMERRLSKKYIQKELNDLLV